MSNYDVTITVNNVKTVVSVKCACSTDARRIVQGQYPTATIHMVSQK